MNYNIAVVRGDGIGPEVIEQALLVLQKVGKKFGHTFQCQDVLAGGAAIDATGMALPQETIDVCKASDAVLLGAVGGPKWDNLPGDQRPEQALLGLRKELGLFANLRPAILFEDLIDACPLKPELVEGGLDIVVVRELTGGIYFGDRGLKDGPMGKTAYDIEEYSEEEVRRIAKVAFEMAMKRNKHVTSVDKANVLETSRLWRRVVAEVAADYPQVTLNHMYVDNAAMQLVRAPRQFDVMVTSNLFGDILSDEASMVAGSIGMLPSASLAKGNFGMYEPAHGSAPDLAGQDKANPMATILSVAMMLRYTFGLLKEARAVEKAVEKVLHNGYRTPDLYQPPDSNPLATAMSMISLPIAGAFGTQTLIGTKQAGKLVSAEI
ncbi:MAG: leuB [Firmicutes bacterium]|nr:leuB [Bacillota bacterium]